MSELCFFLSDLHLRAADDERTQRLCAFLDGPVREASRLYLVGDVFDFWLGYRSVLFHAYWPLLTRLSTLVAKGVQVTLFAGNHDPDPGDFLSRELGLRVCCESLMEPIGPHQVWLEHGDLSDPRGRFRRFICRAARHPALLEAARLVHPDWAWAISRAYAHLGHAPAYREPLPEAILRDLLPARVRAGADVLVLGHFHRAAHLQTEVDGRPATLFALGDWMRHHTYLRYDGAFALLKRQDGGPDLGLGPGDHAP